PTHIYLSPDRSVDRALLAGTIDRSLPFAKKQSVTVLAKDYKSTPQAMQAIANDFTAYYRTNQPAVFASKKASIDRSVATLKQIFGNTRFPEMNVDWRTHRDNVGHLYTLGCFRCHDDQHVIAKGKRIRKVSMYCFTCYGQSGSNA